MNGNTLGVFPEIATGEFRTDMPGAVPDIEVDDTKTIRIGLYPCQLIPCHCNRMGSTIRG